jgi:hypothetical protein
LSDVPSDRSADHNLTYSLAERCIELFASRYLESERERGDGEEHQEDGSDDGFEPEDGPDDVNFLIDPGFITGDETIEPERQQREWIQRRREDDI